MKDKFYCVMQNQNSRNNELHIFKVFEKTGNVACQSIISLRFRHGGEKITNLC